MDLDLNTITEVVRRPADRPGAEWRPGDAWLAGGTLLFSDQQPDLRRLIDVPRTEVLLVETTDSVGPMHSKGMAECCINPVAPALANALADATGVRYRSLPLTPARIYSRLISSRLIPATAT